MGRFSSLAFRMLSEGQELGRAEEGGWIESVGRLEGRVGHGRLLHGLAGLHGSLGLLIELFTASLDRDRETNLCLLL